MSVDSLQITEQAREPGTGPHRFKKGESGNPAGRRKGSKNRKTMIAELLLQGEADNLTRKAVELALGGSESALRLCLDRLIAPRRERTVNFELPPLKEAGDIAAAMIARPMPSATASAHRSAISRPRPRITPCLARPTAHD